MRRTGLEVLQISDQEVARVLARADRPDQDVVLFDEVRDERADGPLAYAEVLSQVRGRHRESATRREQDAQLRPQLGSDLGSDHGILRGLR
jgi:hypothetical protein